MEPTADHVFVPNDLMKNVFMAVSLDTYDDKEDYPGNLFQGTNRLLLKD